MHPIGLLLVIGNQIFY